MKNWFLKHKYLFGVIIINSLIYHRWFSFSIFTYSDYSFQFFETLRQAPVFGVWDSFGLGLVTVLGWRVFGYNSIVYAFFAQFGFDSNVIDKFFVLWPWVILSCIASYSLIKKITKSDVGAAVGSLVFCYSTYFLAIDRSGHLLLSISSVFSLFSLLFFIKTLEEKKISIAIITGLFLAITGFYDFRNLYIILWILFFYFLFYSFTHHEDTSTLFKKSVFASIPILVLTSLNIFWVLASLKTSSLTENSVLSRSLFGSSFFDITRAVTLFHPFWSGGEIEWFKVQQIPLHFWAIPVLAFGGLFTNKKNKNVIFFSFVALVGILLSKQVGEPFTQIYKWLFAHVPGFSAFREASKFYVLITISYAVLIGAFISWISEHFSQGRLRIFTKYTVIILTSCIFLWNAKPIVTGEIGSMYLPRTIDNDYLVFKDFVLKQPGFFRIFWTPTYPRWAVYTNEKPILGQVKINGGEWKYYSALDTNSTLWPFKVTKTFFVPGAEAYFDQASIKYVAVPLDDFENQSDVYSYYGRNEDIQIRDKYIEEINKVDWLKKIDIGTTQLVVYENLNYKPHIYADTGLTYYGTNASKFGDFAMNSNLFLNSDIEKNNFLLSHIDRVVIPVEANSDKTQAIIDTIEAEKDATQKKKLQSELNMFTSNLFLKDYRLQIPIESTYKIYLREDSILAHSKNYYFTLDTKKVIKSYSAKVEDGWLFFNKVDLSQGDHQLKLYVDDVVSDSINSGDLVFATENLNVTNKLPKIEYRQVDHSKYNIRVHGASESFPLIFSENFHPNWKLYLDKNLLDSEGQTREVNQKYNYENLKLPDGNFYDIFFRDEIFTAKHFVINNFANAWWIDLDELKNSAQMSKNSDGSYDFSFILEFESQKYFYIGLFISGVSLFLFLLPILYKFFQWVYNKIIKKG